MSHDWMTDLMTITRADGDTRDVPEAGLCHPRCDGHGWTLTRDPLDALPVPCPVHREHLVGKVGPGRRRQFVSAD